MSEPDRRKAFGDRLRRLRQHRGLVQRKLAVKAGVTPETISHWERGHCYPRRYSIFKLARALDCDRTWLEGIPGARSPIFRDPEETMRP